MSATGTCSCQTHTIGSLVGAGIASGIRNAAILGPHSDPYPVPEYAPREWFTEPPDWFDELLDQGDLLKIRVDDEGRVAGIFYSEGQCLVHMPDACPTPSPTRNAAFHQSHTVTDDGDMIEVGVIGDVGGHADPHASLSVAMAHYANPSKALVQVRAYDVPGVGGIVLGSVIPGKTFGDVATIRRHPLSGDWRSMPNEWWAAHGIGRAAVAECEGYDCIGPTFVNRPGLPLVRKFGRAAAMLGGVGGIDIADDQEAPPMAKTTVTLPGGATITTDAPTDPKTVAPPGPFQAAPPPPPPAGDDAEGGSQAMSPEELTAAVVTLDERLKACEEWISEAMGAQAASIAAGVVPLPERAAS